MELCNPNIRYRIRPGQKEPGDLQSFSVEEWNGSELLRTFQVLIAESQRLTHAPAESDIEKWCELYWDKLPESGGTVKINLDEIQKR